LLEAIMRGLAEAEWRKPRLARLFRGSSGRTLIVPLDHSVSSGPIASGTDLDAVVGAVIAGGADAVVLHKGAASHIDHRRFLSAGLIVHLSASTDLAPDADDKYAVTTVKEALRLHADAVSVHVNLGSDTEARQVATLAQVAESCEKWRMPLLAMVYPRGPRIEHPQDPALLAHAATVASDLGADLVKIPFARSRAEMADIVASCPIPVLAAGGPRLADDAELLAYAHEVHWSGAAGMAIGRNLFERSDIRGMTAHIAAILHGSSTARPALVSGAA
jgi:2-amino-4,5-dihydroxy-6-oxo-7-(phosphonooxy)heptanoate synthase